MIKVEHLSKKYAAATAVDDISFEIGANEIVGFLGPNGAGKSTTLKVLTCYHSATSGAVEVDGHNVFETPEAVKAVIGYLPENVPLYPELRVREYLTYRAGIKKIPRRHHADAVRRVVERCRLETVKDRIIGQLSKGYRQRVGLADALIADPKILILDEPTVGLDPNQIRDVRGLIKELGKERTVILSSHILPEVEAVCSRVIIINKGKIVGQGEPAKLRAQLNTQENNIEIEVIDPNGVAAQIIADISGVKEVVSIQNDTIFRIAQDPERDIREQLFDAAVANGFKLLSIKMMTHSLEDTFVEIITQETQSDESNHPHAAPASSEPAPDVNNENPLSETSPPKKEVDQ